MHEIENHSQELLSILNSIDDPIVSIDHIFQIKRMNVAAKHFTDTPLEAETYEKPCYSTLYGRQNICPFCPLQKLSSNQKEIDIQSIPPMGVRLQILLKIKEKNESLSLSFYPF